MLPEKFIERMKSDLGEECDSFLESLDGDRYQALRINSIKGLNFQDLTEDSEKKGKLKEKSPKKDYVKEEKTGFLIAIWRLVTA